MSVNAFGSGPKSQVDARTETGTADTLLLTDGGKVIRYTSISPVTVTVPLTSTVALPIGTVISIYAAGAGGVTIATAVGASVHNNAAPLAQYDEVSLRKDVGDTWVRLG